MEGATLEEMFLNLMASSNVASQKGMVEMFDSTIGRSTVLMPYGGARQMSETQVSVQKFPVDGYTDTASVMAFGSNPDLALWSPYHSAAYAMVEACTKVACCGAPWSRIRFTFQEYFERMGADPHKWGKPLAALLGALKMQEALGLPSIGGKDSMSGTFDQLNVPPTLVAFGVTTVNAGRVISPELKQPGNRLYLLKHRPLANYMPDTEALKSLWDFLYGAIGEGKVVSAWSLSYGGVAEALVKMAMGNALGVDVVQRCGKIAEPPPHAFLLQRGRFDVRKRMRCAVLAEHEIHHEIKRLGCFVEVEVNDAHDARIAKPGKHPSLGDELLPDDIDMAVV